jgi:phosphatidylglycerophosphate synthase
MSPLASTETIAPGAVVFALPQRGASPLDRVAGLPLLLRTVLTLQKFGISPIVVVTDESAREEVARVCADPRVKAAPEFIAAATEQDGERLAAPVVGARYIRARHHIIADAAAYRALLDAPLHAHDIDGQKYWAVDVTTAAGRHEAVRQLFEACRKPVDGMVSRHINRHVSIFISKCIVETSITPNAISLVNFLLGVVAALCAARGAYLPMLIGAVLFQFNSILDGVDGELARVRHEGSKLGEWLDTVSDDACNVMFYTGVAIGAGAMGLERLSWMGFAAAALGTYTSALYYAELARLGAGDFYALQWEAPHPGLFGQVEGFFRLILKKDFFILLFTVMAAFGVLPWAGPIALFGTLITAVNATVSTIRWISKRGQGVA